MTAEQELRERIARWLFTFVREREDLVLDWEQTKDYYLQEADNLIKEAGYKSPEEIAEIIRQDEADNEAYRLR